MILTKNNSNDFLTWYNNIPESGGFLLINKYKNWTSFDAVAKIRNILRIKKIGHGGTLDPLATGLLLICLGRQATKLSTSYQNMPKVYQATLKLGYTTKSFDLETAEEYCNDINNLSNDEIIKAINSFIGEIEQVPPSYSAISINGVRAYKLARQNQEVEMVSRKVIIYKIENIAINLPYVSFSVECSKGTYIRSLANDIGQRIGCGAFLATLHRTDIAEFNVNYALTIDDIQDFREKYLPDL